MTTVGSLMKKGEHLDRPPVKTEDIAFIQYTSGSTGNPKGVVLTHANLLANIRAIGTAVRIQVDDVFVSWLPLYHDMGLISTWRRVSILAILLWSCPLWISWPVRSDGCGLFIVIGTLTAAPNFAYELCLKRIRDEQIAGLDLSSVRVMANGAEPVSPETLERFSARFSQFGFPPQAMAAVYGLAEATVGLLVPPVGRGPLIDSIQRDPFVSSRRPCRP